MFYDNLKVNNEKECFLETFDLFSNLLYTSSG